MCTLRESIYGLKQSARCWNRALHTVLVKMGFRQCQSDTWLYTRRDGEDMVIVLVYVDDLLVGCKDASIISAVLQELRKCFDITDLGMVKHFLGQEVRREDGCYSLRLTSYIEDLVKRFGLADCNPSKTPMDPGYVRYEDSQPMADVTRYRSLVGALLYISVNSRPDIAASVSFLGRRASQPTINDWKAAKRVLRYLKGTKELKLKFGPGEEWLLRGYSDSDWAGDHDTRKSTTGFVFLYGTGPISWVSRRQTCVTLSSMEAEYVALSDTCQELIWIRRLLSDLEEPPVGATHVFEDNQSCLSFVQAERIRMK